MADRSTKTEKATPQRLKKARKEASSRPRANSSRPFSFWRSCCWPRHDFPAWLTSFKPPCAWACARRFSPNPDARDLLAMIDRLSGAVLRPLAILGLVLLARHGSVPAGFHQSGLQSRASRAEIRPAESGRRKLKEMPGNNMAAFLQAVVMMPVMFWLTWTHGPGPAAGTAASAPDAGCQRRGRGRRLCCSDVLRKASFVLVLLGVVMLVRERARYSSGCA